VGGSFKLRAIGHSSLNTPKIVFDTFISEKPRNATCFEVLGTEEELDGIFNRALVVRGRYWKEDILRNLMRSWNEKSSILS